MKLSETQLKALQVCIQSIITALLLFGQSLLTGGCVLTRGDVHQNNDFSVPIVIPAETSDTETM